MGCDRLPNLSDVLFLCTPAHLLLVVEVDSKPPLEVECDVVACQNVDVSGSFADGTCAAAPVGNHSCALPVGHGNLTSFVHFLAGIGDLLFVLLLLPPSCLSWNLFRVVRRCVASFALHTSRRYLYSHG